MRAIAGSCHCENIRFLLEWPDSAASIAARSCGCDFCTKHGGTWTSHPEAKLRVQIANEDSVSRYRFATETANFVICSACGVVPLVLSEIEGIRYAVVNVNTFEDFERSRISVHPISFDGEETADRLQRRKSNWIPYVELA